MVGMTTCHRLANTGDKSGSILKKNYLKFVNTFPIPATSQVGLLTERILRLSLSSRRLLLDNQEHYPSAVNVEGLRPGPITR